LIDKLQSLLSTKSVNISPFPFSALLVKPNRQCGQSGLPGEGVFSEMYEKSAIPELK
jgi:hypothetical protein